MICGTGEALIGVPAQDVLEFVLDLRRYAEADTKIRRIEGVERDGNRGTARHGGRLRGLPGPPVTLDFELEPYTRLEFHNTGRNFVDRFYQFTGTFTCEETPEGTRVVHRECFEFAPPLRWFFEWFLRDWLPHDTADEVGRMKRILESEA